MKSELVPNVLILVFVEYGFREQVVNLGREGNPVLILVFVEYGFREDELFSTAINPGCLNPCFCGVWF